MCVVVTSLQEEIPTHTHLPLSASTSGWLQMVENVDSTNTNSPLQCPAYPVLPLAPLKAAWEPTVFENQSML